MDFRRLFDLFAYQQMRFPQQAALAIREALGWRNYSTEECLELIDQVSAGALSLGLERGEKIAIITSTGSPVWNLLDLGFQQIGVIVVPIHATVTREELEFILKETQARYCIAGNRELFDFVSSSRNNILSLKAIFTMAPTPDLPGMEHFFRQPTERHRETIHSIKSAIHEDDLATIIYTSGSTGQPKGVMLSHKNIVSNIKAVITLIPINCEKRVISFLPLSHVFERMVVFTYIAVGASVYYVGNRESVFEDIREIRPHYFTAVPRLLEKMQDHILERSAGYSPLKRRVIRWAITLGRQYQEDRRMPFDYWLKNRVADWLVYRHWRRRLGSKIEGIVVGAAALAPDLGRLFSAAGIEIREGYGLTETSPVIAFNRFDPGGVRFGTVGIPIPGVEVRIDAPDENGDGEILVKGPNVMMGYYNHPEDNEEVFTAEGWLRTGDLGRTVHKRFLRITGRKRDLFKTSSGKFIAPEPLELQLKTSPFIEQCLVAGRNRPYPVALILPHFPLLKNWCEENNVHWTAPQFMVLNPKVTELFSNELIDLNKALPNYRQIRKFHLLHLPWTPETGELTPTLKPRRELLLKKFESELDHLYSE